MNKLDNKLILLKACHDLLKKQELSLTVLDLLKEKIKYNDDYNTGYELLNAIEMELYSNKI